MNHEPEWTKKDIQDLVDLIMNGDMYLKDLNSLED